MITVDLNKAKLIAHDIRRKKRDKEFAPLDDLIAKKIPQTNEAAIESQRQIIREKYTNLQSKIDSSTNVEELSSCLNF